MSEVKFQSQIIYPVSNQCNSVWFPVNWPNNSRDMANKVFDLEKKIPKFGEEKIFYFYNKNDTPQLTHMWVSTEQSAQRIGLGYIMLALLREKASEIVWEHNVCLHRTPMID